MALYYQTEAGCWTSVELILRRFDQDCCFKFFVTICPKNVNDDVVVEFFVQHGANLCRHQSGC